MSIEVGNILEGVVTGITKFGAFVELPGGKVGLVHISEVADVYVKDVNDFLKEKDKVKVKVLSVDDHGKIGLSIKQLQEKKVEEQNTRPAPRKQFNNDFRKHNNSGASFEDKLSKFLKDSDEKLTDLRRKTDSKRGGRGGGSRKYE
ncbi:S1 domain-containing RNA-binding protein [Megamonas funiformis]|uniref:S1 domain-containing RNA-binding protein n=1 Tax=Megamonas funiformis TaxID=437897 RepID=UPI0039F44D44